MSFTLTSPAFAEGDTIPHTYTGDGEDRSPPLSWTDPPAGTRSFVLICDDPDAPRRTFIHWIAFNLPPETRALREGAGAKGKLPDGAGAGTNDFDRTTYGGPAPPPGRPHRYFFRLCALDEPLDLNSGASQTEVMAAMKDHILAETQLMGLYGR